MTHEAIVLAAIDLAVTDGFGVLTMEKVAERAGVSASTLYRYFPDRERLLTALADHAGAKNAPYLATNPDEIPSMYERLMAALDEDRALNRAIVTARVGGGLPWPQREERVAAISAALDEVTDRLPADEATRAKAVIAYLASGLAWLTMADESGLEGAESGRAVAWAVRTLIQDLRARNDSAKRTRKSSRRKPTPIGKGKG